MSAKVGVVRRESDLLEALTELRRLSSAARFAQPGPAEFEFLNLLTLGTQIAKTALLREESRGVHIRDDFPERDDRHWRRHITLRLPEFQQELRSAPTNESSPRTRRREP
jgi:L-aspartate oxidase